MGNSMPSRAWSRQFDATPWLLRLRSRPAADCPSEASLSLFAREPLAIPAASYSHILGGCPSCRSRLRRLLLESAPS